MFRELRRKKNAISIEEAKLLLKNEARGIFAVNGDDGYPYAIPVNYFYDEESNRIYFHGAKAGHKIDSIKKNNKVCFTVYGDTHYVEGEWAPYTKSTVCFGKCNLISDPEIKEEKLIELATKYYPSREEVDEEMKQSAKAAQIYEIVIENLCGKQVQER